MLAVIIVIAVILLLLAILLPRVYLNVAAGDTLRIELRVLHLFRIRLYPKKQRIPNIHRFTAKKLRKQEQKQLRKELRTQKKQKKQSTKHDQPEKKAPLTEQLRMIIALVRTVLPRFGHALRIDLSRIIIRIASPDAAQTAILYGTFSQSVSYLLTLLDQITNVKTNRQSVLAVNADFLSEKMSAEIRLSFSISPIRAIGIGLAAGFRLIRFRLEQGKKAS